MENTEQQLRAEIEDLRKRLSERDRQVPHEGTGHKHQGPGKPSAGVLLFLAFLVAVIVGAAFLTGYLPHAERQSALVKAAKEEGTQDLVVTVAKLTRSSQTSKLALPGNIQAITEAPIMARATGYLKQRVVDIGDKVKQGQLL